MNLPQQTFLVFYAIMWGTLANALPRWKAFDTGSFFSSDVSNNWSRRRFCLSTIMLNLLPFAYAALLLFALDTKAWQFISLHPNGFSRIGRTFLATLPALAPFGFYRLWLVAIGAKRALFYPPVGSDKRFQDIEYDLDLSRRGIRGNSFAGVLYVLLPAGVVVLFSCV